MEEPVPTVDMTAEAIPTVDMQSNDLDGLSDEERQETVGKRILDALKSIGFVYLLNHGLQEQLRQSAYQSASSFFTLPLETKLKYHRFIRTRVNGYTPLRDEVLSNLHQAGAQTLLELKEAWDIMVPGEDMPTEEAPQFCRDMEALMCALSALSARVMGALESALRRPGLRLTASHRQQLGRGNGTVLRAVHYPPLPDSEQELPAGAVRCAAHTDWGSLILLLQDQCGGLEVLSHATDTWVPAPPVPGAVLVNAGDLMEIWTGGEIRATRHRVTIPQERRLRSTDRLSIILFCQPDDDTMVTPPDGSSGYQAVNAGEYLAAKYRACLLKYKQ